MGKDSDAGGDGRGQSHVAVSFLGKEAFVTLKSPKGQGLWPALLSSMETHNFNVVEANLTTTAHGTHVHSIHAHITDKACLGSEELKSLLEELVSKKLNAKCH